MRSFNWMAPLRNCQLTSAVKERTAHGARITNTTFQQQTDVTIHSMHCTYFAHTQTHSYFYYSMVNYTHKSPHLRAVICTEKPDNTKVYFIHTYHVRLQTKRPSATTKQASEHRVLFARWLLIWLFALVGPSSILVVGYVDDSDSVKYPGINK